MDDLDIPAGDAASSPAKKTRKPAGRRPRTAAADTVSAIQAAVASAEIAAAEVTAKPVRRGRTRRGPVAEASAVSAPTSAPAIIEAPGLFDDVRPEAPAPVSTEVAPPFVASFSPDDPSPGEADGLYPEPSAFAQSRDSSPAVVDVPEPEEMGSTSGERPVFVPQSTSEVPTPGNEESSGGGGPDAAPGSDGQAGGPRREERKTWWERKKEKKRLKWLERQQGGGHPGGIHAGGPQAGGPPPAFGGAPVPFAGEPDRGPPRGEFRPRERDRDRPLAQPPPPALQGPVGGLPDASRFAEFSALDAMADELAKDVQPMDLAAVHEAPAGDLAQRLRALGETIVGMPPRRMLVDQLFAWSAREKRAFRETGLLDLSDAGHGFIVHRCNSYRLQLESTYVPPALVKRHALRRGQELTILVQAPQPGERCPVAVRVLSVMGTTPELAREVTAFEELIPYYPTSRILVEAPEIHKDISMRAVDLLTPIGFGQRGLIVAPPRTGKTVLMQNIANSISHNYPEVTLILLLIDERPEEVTDFKRHTKGEVVSSTFDETPESHVHAAEMVIERARRLVELGKHVVILLDSVTRLARAYNALAGNGGKTMSGGIESNALQRPKRFFGSARNIEGGGSLTILGTALVDTNSRMDEVIFEEFKGTGNMELHLDRGLSDKRIFPAINIDRSGTRKEELIYHPDEMLRVYGLRRAMQGIPPVEAMDMFIQRLKKTRTNTEFLLSLNR